MKNLSAVLLVSWFFTLPAQATDLGGTYDYLRFSDPKIDDKLQAQLIAEQNLLNQREATCAQPMTLDKAKEYIFAQREEILKKRHDEENSDPIKRLLAKYLLSGSASQDLQEEMYMTKTMTKTMSKNMYSNRNRQRSLTDLQYLEGVARAYVSSINEGCSMCQDEQRIASKRQELLQAIGYNGQPSCRPHASRSPEIVILYEDHTVQERGAFPTAKRGLLADLTKADPSVLVVSEALSKDAEPVAQARLFDFFKLPVNRQLFGENGIPNQTDSKLLGLDADPLIAVRTLQIALDSMEQKYVTGSMTGQNITGGNRAAFFEFVLKNKNVRALLEKLSTNATGGFLAKAGGEINRNREVVSSASIESTNSKIFGEHPRLPMDKDLTTIWTDTRYSQYRDIIGRLAEAFLQGDGAAKYAVNSKTGEPFWNASYQKISNTALPRYNIDKFDDASFYFLMRTLLYMAMNDVPEITTPETAGGLYRDWAFTENIESAICSARQTDGVKKIVVSLGRDHATRIADFLRKDGFANDYNLRFLNADALNEGTVMGAINSGLNHEDNLLNAGGGYKEQCNGYNPPSHLTAGNATPVSNSNGRSQ